MTYQPPAYPPPGTSVPYQTGALEAKDVDHLRMLSICWYIISGLQCIGLIMGVIVAILGIALLAGGHSRDEGPGVLFLIAGIFTILMTLVVSCLSFLTARSLSQRRRITLIYICAGILCISPPLGTLLGIFTFIVVNRPAVKASFH